MTTEDLRAERSVTFSATLRALFCALSAFALAALCWLIAFHTSAGVRLDSHALNGFTALSLPHIRRSADLIAHLADPLPFTLSLLAIALIALAQREWLLAVITPLALVGANLTTQIFKPLLASQRFAEWLGVNQVPDSAWPSGHSTAAISIAVGMVIVAPRSLRPLVAIAAAAFAIGVGYSVVMLGWHYPSDVLGAFLITAGWALLVLAVLAVRRRRPSAETTSRWQEGLTLRPLISGCVALVIGIALAIAITRPEALRLYAGTQTAFIAAAAAIGLLGATVVIGVSEWRDRLEA